jgi:AcrR family transcriptional regulator
MNGILSAMCPKSREDCAKIRENTKGCLLDAALKIFAKDGYNGSSMAQIAKEANVSKGLAYHYFKSKEEILVTLAGQRLQEWLPLTTGLESISDPMKRLIFLIEFVLGELTEKLEILRFFNALYLTKEGVRAIEKAMKKYPFERQFKAERQLFIDLGYTEPDLEATFLRSTLQGICLEYMLGPKDYPLEEIKQKLIERYEIQTVQRT